MTNVRHKGTPAEPFATPHSYGVVTRMTPSKKGIPAMAHVAWGDEDVYYTWERLSDLTILKERKR